MLSNDPLVKSLLEDWVQNYLIGKDPMSVELHWTRLYLDNMDKGGRLFSTALSGIDIALWDLKGKILNSPVYSLLGGPYQEKIRVYANGWAGKNVPVENKNHSTKPLTQPERLAILAKETVNDGFTALKFDPIPGPWRTHIDKRTEFQAIENVEAVRDAVGNDIDILVEIH